VNIITGDNPRAAALLAERVSSNNASARADKQS
jgi:hypothetical protein